MAIIFPILPFVLLFAVVLTIIIKRSDKRQAEDIESFWQRENRAKLTRAVDLTTLPYLNVPIDKFSFGTLEDPNVKEIEESILAISKKPLLNLTGKTNTELRETYGSPNLEAMQAIGDDFDKLTVSLCNYAQALYDSGHINEAIPVLEYGMYIKSDISTTYTLLADCFYSRQQKRRIETLREEVAKTELFMRSAIIKHIDTLLSQIDGDMIQPIESIETTSLSDKDQ